MQVRVRNFDALASGQAVGLYDVTPKLTDVIRNAIHIVKDFEARVAWNPVLLQKPARECFARFQSGECLGWSHTRNSDFRETINKAFRQRLFRSDNYKIAFVV